MGTSPSRKRRARTMGRARTATHPAPADDQVVAEAEDIVLDAWVQAMIGHREQKQADAQAADAKCETARRTLAVALVEREPVRIAAAHTSLDEALTAARAADNLFAQASHELVVELDELAWRSAKRIVEACIARNAPSACGGAGPRPADPAAHVPVLIRLARRLMPWVVFIAVGFTAGARPS